MERSSGTASARLQRVEAEGRLAVKRAARGSVIDRLYQSGAAKIRFPSPSDKTVCEAVLINTAGGLTGGDRLYWILHAGTATKLVCTSQACERIYRSRDSEPARLSVRISVGDNARLDWLPQETILFDGCALERSFDADLAPSASLLIVEAFVFGRTAMGEIVNQADVKDRWTVRRGGQLVFADAVRFTGNDVDNRLRRRAVAKGDRALATVALIAPNAERYLSLIREEFPDIACSAFAGKLLARMTATGAQDLRRVLIPLAEKLSNGNALPKVWAV
ncbi:urease accessory protein UreD [Nordella sp. HKS 07]|uniref:urease accessory protein UreD n=1 Tax=Nordella sp. HKS 07 TaxID=2712222 RepID=UPI0013E1DE8F|nr:urease accessory protein UreD [Nordella sp. HKS 07]QIG49528.1 urease accessory protein UreD [Nordella sp. HKS 07]